MSKSSGLRKLASALGIAAAIAAAAVTSMTATQHTSATARVAQLVCVDPRKDCPQPSNGLATTVTASTQPAIAQPVAAKTTGTRVTSARATLDCLPNDKTCGPTP